MGFQWRLKLILEKENDVIPPRPVDPNILAVIIHQSDKLRTDINMYHPIVRVHIIDLDMNGEYVKKLDK